MFEDRPEGFEEWFDAILMSERWPLLLAIAAVVTLVIIGVGVGLA